MQVNLLLTVLVTFIPFYHSLAMLHYINEDYYLSG
jgi:hypothetical protein